MAILLKLLIKDERGEKMDSVWWGLTQGGIGAWRQSCSGAEGRWGGCGGHASFGTGGSVHVYVTAGTLEGTRGWGHPRADHFTWGNVTHTWFTDMAKWHVCIYVLSISKNSVSLLTSCNRSSNNTLHWQRSTAGMQIKYFAKAVWLE